jgi:hypothetical protein
VHALESSVPAGDDTVSAVREGDGFGAGMVEGGFELGAVGEPAGVVDGVILAVFGEWAGPDLDIDVLDGVEGLRDADYFGDVRGCGCDLCSGGGVVCGGCDCCFCGGGRLGGGCGGEGGQEGDRGKLCGHYGSSLGCFGCFFVELSWWFVVLLWCSGGEGRPEPLPLPPQGILRVSHFICSACEMELAAKYCK